MSDRELYPWEKPGLQPVPAPTLDPIPAPEPLPAQDDEERIFDIEEVDLEDDD